MPAEVNAPAQIEEAHLVIPAEVHSHAQMEEARREKKAQCLKEKYKRQQDIRKKDYDEEHSYCMSDPGEEDMMMAIGKFDYTDGIFGDVHPVEHETAQNLTYICALVKWELPPVRGKCFCPLSAQAREWRMTNGVSCEMSGVHCGKKCRGEFESRRDLENHLRQRGKSEDMHRYTFEFMTEE
jgi:hypothetical protein